MDMPSNQISEKQCPLCHRKFTRRASCVRHLETCVKRHDRKENFNCPNCLTGFSRKSYLYKHIKTCPLKHLKKDIKPYKCEHCNKEFTRRDHLTKHSKKCPKFPLSLNTLSTEKCNNSVSPMLEENLISPLFEKMSETKSYKSCDQLSAEEKKKFEDCNPVDPESPLIKFANPDYNIIFKQNSTDFTSDFYKDECK